MMLRKLMVGIAAALTFGAGAIAADFGSAPSNYEATAKEYISERLEDPRAARYNFVSEPYQVYADLRGYEGLPCWAVDVRVKARTPQGTGGFVPYTVIFLDGEAIALRDDLRRMARL